MCGSGEEVLNEIAFLFLGSTFACLHTDHTFPATALCTKRANGGAFDKTAMRDADDAALVRDEVFDIDFGCLRNDFRQARRTVFVANFAQFLYDDSENALLFGENVSQILDGIDELLVLLIDLFALEAGQLIQAEIENVVGLLLAECIPPIGQARRIANQNPDLFHLTLCEFECEQFYPRFVTIGRPANDAEKFIEIRERNEITFKRLSALFRLAQFTPYGISVITICSRPPLSSSMPALPRTFMLPRPVSKYCRIPPTPQRTQPVGKSGPFTCFISSSSVMSGLSICAQIPSMTSERLCGGMLVAMPTAMPVPPLTSRLGNAAGKTVGSVRVSS